jgi:uncharacterized peroxidase-related enzyme
MAIRPVEKNDAPEAVRTIYEALEKNLGRVPNMFKMLAHQPVVLRTFLPFYNAVWAEGTLPQKLKALAAVRTSLLNGCEYWTRAYSAQAARFGVGQAQIDALKAPGGRRNASLFSPEEQAVLRFTDLLTSYPGNIDSVDVEQLQARFSEAQIVELVVTIATTNWTNRINDGLQTPLG